MLKCMHYNQVGSDMLKICSMDEESARTISLWDFGDSYAYYNLNGEETAIQEFLNGHYYVVFKEEDIFGFFCDGDSAQVDMMSVNLNEIDFGFALNPMFIGRGYGRSFIKMIMHFYHRYHDVCHFRLTVASFNTRAVYLYHRIGFEFKDEISMIENGTLTKFYVMRRDFNLKTDEDIPDLLYSYIRK